MQRAFLAEESGIPLSKKPAPPISRPPKNYNLLVTVGRYDFSAIAWNLCQAVNRYTPGWRARSIVGLPHMFRWPTDLIANKENKGAIERSLRDADFLLFSSSYFFYRPLDMKLPLDIPWGLWHGGRYFRENHDRMIEKVHPCFDFVFAHRDLSVLGEKVHTLQAPFDTDKHNYIPKDFFGRLIIGHSPSREQVKGTTEFMAAINHLKKKYGEEVIEVLLIKDLCFNEALAQKRDIHLFFDQFSSRYFPPGAIRGYGTSLIEAASYGAVCLNHDYFEDTPVIKVHNKSDLIRELSLLIEDRDRLEKLSHIHRRWVHSVHGYEAMAEYFMDIIDAGGYINRLKRSISANRKRHNTKMNRNMVRGRPRV